MLKNNSISYFVIIQAFNLIYIKIMICKVYSLKENKKKMNLRQKAILITISRNMITFFINLKFSCLDINFYAID